MNWAAPTWYYDDLSITIGPTIPGAGKGGGGGCRRRRHLRAISPVAEHASIFYGLFDTPGIANSRSGFSAAAGVFVSKSMMTFPWAQVAFTIAPEG